MKSKTVKILKIMGLSLLFAFFSTLSLITGSDTEAITRVYEKLTQEKRSIKSGHLIKKRTAASVSM